MEKLAIFSGLVFVLILATGTVALADESILAQSFPNLDISSSLDSSQGHVNDISWIKKISSEGVIEIDGILFSITNEGENEHLFEVCAVIEGPIGIFTSSSDGSPSCTVSESIKSNEQLTNQIIEFSNGVKVSEMIDLSIIIQEF